MLLFANFRCYPRLTRAGVDLCSLSTVTFSEDSTVMATGSTESYIRLWSLNGKGLRALRTDLTGDEVNKTTTGRSNSIWERPETSKKWVS